MVVTQFGSCRTLCINNLVNTTKLNEDISFTHNTKEHLQLIKFIKGELQVPPEISTYCFRSSIIYPRGLYERQYGDPKGDQLVNFWKKNKHPYHIAYKEEFKKRFENTDVFVVEICAIKKYTYQNYHIHHLAVDKRFGEWMLTDEHILNNTEKSYQDYNELKSDIIELKRQLYPKKLIVMTHINAKFGNDLIPARNTLIKMLEDITKEFGIKCFNPTISLDLHNQYDIISDDLGHYKELGKQIIGKLLLEKIKE